ncbi:hypothetical protein CRS_15230 [Chryseobacterium sp. ON_d1]|nr:hypothetical protein CRS_15230 [Chryseobacterium sp. ON_d1]
MGHTITDNNKTNTERIQPLKTRLHKIYLWAVSSGRNRNNRKYRSGKTAGIR